MPDSLAHVVAAYVVFQVAVWTPIQVQKSDITVGMVGALIPDVSKLHILVSAQTVERMAGIPFSWDPLGDFWGIVVLAGIGSLLVTAERRRRVFRVLLLGAFSHMILDSLNAVPGEVRLGLLDIVLDPPSLLFNQFPDVYTSGDYWPTILLVGVGIVVLVIDRRY